MKWLQIPRAAAAAVFVLASVLAAPARAQEGLAPNELIEPRHELDFGPDRADFNDALVKRLQAPPGFRVDVFATGLVEPRMMARGDDGTIYITRRHIGDVVALPDANGDGK